MHRLCLQPSKVVFYVNKKLIEIVILTVTPGQIKRLRLSSSLVTHDPTIPISVWPTGSPRLTPVDSSVRSCISVLFIAGRPSRAPG